MTPATSWANIAANANDATSAPAALDGQDAAPKPPPTAAAEADDTAPLVDSAQATNGTAQSSLPSTTSAWGPGTTAVSAAPPRTNGEPNGTVHVNGNHAAKGPAPSSKPATSKMSWAQIARYVLARDPMS